MLKITFLEFIFIAIPESLLFILLAYIFSKNTIEIKRYLLSSTLFATGVYLFRFLPIQHGADTVLNLFLLIALLSTINKLNIITSIKAAIITMIIEFICEVMNIWIIRYIMQKDVSRVLKNSYSKVLYTSPSLLILGCAVVLYYIISKKRKRLDGLYGKTNK